MVIVACAYNPSTGELETGRFDMASMVRSCLPGLLQQRENVSSSMWCTPENLRIWEVKSGGSEIQGHPQPYSQLGASLDHWKLSQTSKNNNKNKATAPLEMLVPTLTAVLETTNLTWYFGSCSLACCKDPPELWKEPPPLPTLPLS